MKVGDLGLEHFARRLARDGVAIRWGPFVSRIVSRLPELAAPIHLLYADFPIEPPGSICDFHVLLKRHGTPLSRQAQFLCGGTRVLKPFPRKSALTVLEWRLNWCVYAFACRFLILHAAVVERDGVALLLPGHSGVGKSTLCAGLVASGWRLLSDELALLDPADGLLRPLARPISLKNESIELIRTIARDATFGPVATDTAKGRIAHMKPPTSSVDRADDCASPGLIVLPRFERDAQLRLTSATKTSTFFELAQNSLSYDVLREVGFRALTRLVDGSDCYRLAYSSLDEVVATLDDLIRSISSKSRCRSRSLATISS